jgi:thioredoxin 1
MADSLVKHVSDVVFEAEVLQSSLPVLVDFWAPWCAPCRMVGPILDDLSKEYDGRLVIAKLNVDENQETPVRYGIRGIPTIILFKEGKVVAHQVGASPKAKLKAFIDAHLS